MRHSLLIYLHADQQVSWATFGPTGQVIDSATNVPLDTVPHQHSAQLVLIPGAEVVLTQANIPSKKRQQLLQAVPYALEEQLAEDIENLHFALEMQSDKIMVAVIAHAQMSAYIQQLTTAGLRPTGLMPDILAVPKPADGWGILYLNDMVLVRTGLRTGFAIEADCLDVALQMALAEHPHPEQITVFSGAQPMNALIDLHDIPVTEKTHEQGVLAWLAQGASDNKPLNLLQGDYRPQDKMASLLRPWRFTAILLLLLGGLHVAKQWVAYQQLSQQRQTLSTQIEKVYRETFPEARKIVNPRVQMEQRLKALQAQQGSAASEDHFLSILNKISAPLTHTSGFNLKRIDYRQKRFDLQLEVENLQILENLKQRLSNLGLTVEIQSASSRNQLVESRLRIQ